MSVAVPAGAATPLNTHRTGSQVQRVEPGTFHPPRHFYPRVLNAHIHPLLRYFFALDNQRVAERYCHLHPEVQLDSVKTLLDAKPSHFRWGGADLFHVTTEHAVRRIVVIETNSCPSGQKSMPVLHETQEQAGYRVLLERAFLPMLRRRTLPAGGLAVLYDKNLMESSGYAAALADLTGEDVYLVPFDSQHWHQHGRFTKDGLLAICNDGTWVPIRAALRYVTQKPWDRIPPITKTLIFNSTLVCLAGGRNKMLASKAYEFLNGELQPTGLRIRTPETIADVSLQEVPLWVERMGGVAVVKIPYSNAGQGVFTITNERERDAFMAGEYNYDRFLVQALIGNSSWSSRGESGRLYHVGTVPSRKSEMYVSDIRFMVGGGPQGFFPVAVYARRARSPLLPRSTAHLRGTCWAPTCRCYAPTGFGTRKRNGCS